MLSAVSLETEFIKTEFVSINVISPDEFFSMVTISEYLTPLFIASETEELTADMAKDSTFAAQILTRTAEKELVIETIAAIIAKNKAKNIKSMACALVKEHNGNVPDNMESLVKLPGVGRKTANVVLGNAFKVPGMVVDTHVKRISNRYGLTKNSDPEKIEQDLMKIFPKERWTELSHQLVLFGRYFCMAKKPNCNECKIFAYCPTGNKLVK